MKKKANIDQFPPPPELLTLFVKTEQAFHQGGFTFFSLDEFDAARPAVEKQVAHICETNHHTLVSWGLTDASGQMVKEFQQ